MHTPRKGPSPRPASRCTRLWVIFPLTIYPVTSTAIDSPTQRSFSFSKPVPLFRLLRTRPTHEMRLVVTSLCFHGLDLRRSRNNMTS
ncbi:hypothetical protein DL96DRAFT_1617312 [Flagelloscypha sp. PMI_526]|nr:hypothetical protein DL96DRAFT_1617312 [Flagelloscypha sp. PMI_526]